MFMLMLKLKSLKARLRDWNKTVFGNFHDTVLNARKKHEEIQIQIAKEGNIAELLTEEVRAKEKLLHAVEAQESYWRDRGRLAWLKDGDKNSKLFHTYAKIQKSKSRISGLRIGERWCDNLEDVASHVIDYYKNLFSDQSHGASQDYSTCSIIPTSVTDEDNEILTSIPSGREIKDVVFQMNPASAPGTDGFSGAFYHACWNIIAKDVIARVQQFFTDSYLLPNINSSFLVLLPKTDDASTI